MFCPRLSPLRAESTLASIISLTHLIIGVRGDKWGQKGLNARYIGILGRFYLSPPFRIVPWGRNRRGQNNAKVLCMGVFEGTILSQDLYVMLFPFYWTKTSYHDKI